MRAGLPPHFFAVLPYSFSHSPAAVHCGSLDAAEDTNPDALWFWELREPKKALVPQQPQQQQGGSAVKAAPVPRNSAAAANKKLVDLYRRRRKDVSGMWQSLCAFGGRGRVVGA